MAVRVLQQSDIIVGVDTHKDEHVAFAVNGVGVKVAESASMPATPAGYAELRVWAENLGKIDSFGVEGCGSYGSGLARHLRLHEHKVHEVTRPPRKGERRLSGKSDAIDAEHAARLVLTGEGIVTPKTSDGIVEALRLVKITRDTAVKAQSTTMITLKTVVVTAPDQLRTMLEQCTNHQLILACEGLDTAGDIADPDVAIRRALAALAARYLVLHEEIKTHSADLKKLVKQAAPQMIERFGIGPDSAAELMITAGDNSNRISTESKFAKLCGACPIPAGSGKTSGRHRLNRGGNRQANAALYRIVIVRMRWHPPTIAYVERRTTEGLTKKDIIRCLKRFVAREVYHLLPPKNQTEKPQTTT